LLDYEPRRFYRDFRFSMLRVLVTDPMMDLREPPNRGEVFRRQFQDVFEFGASLR
jgi:hypothetical protein